MYSVIFFRKVVSLSTFALSIIFRTSPKSLLSKIFFTGPIDAGLIDNVFIPIAARQSASTGLPASSPQKDNLVLFLSHLSTIKNKFKNR